MNVCIQMWGRSQGKNLSFERKVKWTRVSIHPFSWYMINPTSIAAVCMMKIILMTVTWRWWCWLSSCLFFLLLFRFLHRIGLPSCISLVPPHHHHHHYSYFRVKKRFLEDLDFFCYVDIDLDILYIWPSYTHYFSQKNHLNSQVISPHTHHIQQGRA